MPFSDPLADGPVIHAAATAALRAGATLAGVLEVGRAIAERVPVVVMCYANPILARGLERFADALVQAGRSGLIVPDLPLEEAPAVLAACDARGLALVPLVAPTTPDERLARIGAQARGFLYTVSLTGTTGERAALDGALAAAGRAVAAAAPRSRSRSASGSARRRRRGRRRRRSGRRDRRHPPGPRRAGGAGSRQRGADARRASSPARCSRPPLS